jgi:hypothetical protein
MTIKIFDLEQDQSLLVELEEKDMNKVCGGAGAVDASIQEAKAIAEDQIRLQDSMTKIQAEAQAAQSKASIDAAVSRNVSEAAKSIR